MILSFCAFLYLTGLSSVIAGEIFADGSIHEHSQRLSRLLTDYVQLADPVTVDPRLV